MKSRMNPREMTKIALCVALLCVASYLSFPIPFTPIVITGQTLMVHLLGLVLAPVSALVAMVVYLLLGIVGLPVFAGGSAGIGVLLGPTGGYILGFVAAAPMVSLCKGKKVNLFRYLFATVLVGTLVIDFLGSAFFCMQQQISLLEGFALTVVPFLPGDIIKCVMASVVGVAVNRIPGFQASPVSR